MPGKSLIELLNDLEHVGELGRLLSIFSGRNLKTCGRRELIEFILQTGGIHHRSPKPESALDTALYLGLLNKRGHLYQLSSVGEQFASGHAMASLGLSSYQGTLLLGIFLDDRFFRVQVQALFRLFRTSSVGDLELQPSSLSQSHELATIARFLQQLGCLLHRENLFFLNPEFRRALPTEVENVVAVTEEALWESLERHRQRAKEIEEFIVREEQHRLINAGRSDLADAVVRVSALDVARGYDIDSHEVNGEPRFIEVKSSTGKQIRFEWSASERKTAERFGPKYWIYFVPLAHLLPKGYCPAVMIRDPIKHIRSEDLVETSSSTLVTTANRSALERGFSFSSELRLIEWGATVR